MPRKRSPTLTDTELRLMNVLWEKGRAPVGEVLDALPGRRRPAYNSVLTLMRILERKGYVGHDKAGRAFVYYPKIDRADVRRNVLRYLLDRFFDDSPTLLVLNVLEDERVDRRELEQLRKLIDESE